MRGFTEGQYIALNHFLHFYDVKCSFDELIRYISDDEEEAEEDEEQDGVYIGKWYPVSEYYNWNKRILSDEIESLAKMVDDAIKEKLVEFCNAVMNQVI